MVAEDLREAENLLDWREQRENLCMTFWPVRGPEPVTSSERPFPAHQSSKRR
jgi:hypothetical protein